MKTIVFAGCGGGYDIFGCLPMYYNVKNDHDVIITNLSFTNYKMMEEFSQTHPNDVQCVYKDCYRVNPGNYADDIDYFPEYLLANKLNLPVYALCNYDTVQEMKEFYEVILSGTDVDIFYMVDGGCDSFLSGNESDLATYVEDMMHFKASTLLTNVRELILMAVVLNSDCGHGVIEEELVNRISELENKNIVIKKEVMSLNNPEIKYYYDTFLECKPHHSLVHSFVTAALEGITGKVVPERAKCRIGINKTVNISDLTKTLIIMNGRELAKTIVYFDKITETITSEDVANFY